MSNAKIAALICFLAATAFADAAANSFTATGNLGGSRFSHTETLLPNGKVLIAGGSSGSANLDTAELYDPATGTVTPAGVMTSTRVGHTATLLPNGTVLLAGGVSSGTVNTAELYNPANNTFTPTGSMTGARANHTATLLPNGQVLVAGGDTITASLNITPLNTTELYASGVFTPSGNLQAPRRSHTATLLPNGKVFIAGGSADGNAAVNSAELYDSGTTTAIVNVMSAARFRHTATLLPNGRVFIYGGSSSWFGTSLGTGEVYNPADNGFTSTGATTARQSHSATLLPNGKVLIAGGVGNGLSSAPIDTAQLYEPGAGSFTSTTNNLAGARWNHTATLLPGGSVLIAGGQNPSALNSAQLFDFQVGTFTVAAANSADAVFANTSTLLPDGKVLIAGGRPDRTTHTNAAQLYDFASGTFTATGSMSAQRSSHTATLLSGGKVLIAGGISELYDPASGTFSPTGSMSSSRYGHTATLLADGKVLIAGGVDGAYVNTAELYDPLSGTFTATSPMSSPRSFHTATLLADGKVFMAGGSAGLDSELYDPATGTFSTISAPMSVNRSGHKATLLHNGKVLLVGGSDALGWGAESAELYDPAGGTFTTIAYAGYAIRNGASATLLPSGKVLIAGGRNPESGGTSTAELYDPATGLFTGISALMSSGRIAHTATLLPNGKVLLAFGYDYDVNTTLAVPVNTAEVFDPGLGHSDARRPVVSAPASPLCLPTTLSLSGTFFTGDSEGSGGSTNSSAGNAPLLRMQRIEGDRFLFAPQAQAFSASSLFSATLASLPSGHYRVAVVSNAIPSVERIIAVATTPLLGTYGSSTVNADKSTAVVPSSLPGGYNDAFYPVTATASAGFTGTVRINASTGVVTITNAGPIGDYTITISSSTVCGSANTSFALAVLGPPFSMTATGGTPQSAETLMPFASPLQVTVRDSAGHALRNVGVTFTGPVSGARAILSNGGSAQTNTAGVASVTATANGSVGAYNVDAVAGSLTATFSLTNTPATPTSVSATATTQTSVSVVWNGTIGATYEVVRIAAGAVSSTRGTSTSGTFTDTVTANAVYLYKVRAIAPSSTAFGVPDLATTIVFTDPALTAGSMIRAAHFSEMRTAVNAVRSLLGLTAFAFTDATLTGSTIKLLHLTELRTLLNDARTSLLMNPATATYPGTAGSVIHAADVNDLRSGVQ